MQYLRFLVLMALLFGCKESEKADYVIWNAQIYTSDTSKMSANAMAIKGNRFLKVGNYEEMKELIGSKTVVENWQGSFIMPGIIEGHGHFLGLGESLSSLNLINTKSWTEILDSVKSVVQRTPEGQWIEGRGWHQEKWNDQLLKTYNKYPYHDELSKISPKHPVVLYHASGHALIANQKAMDVALISAENRNPEGGRVVMDHMGKLLGVFEENAMNLISNPYESYLKSMDLKEQIKIKKNQAVKASQEALKYGITCFQDAGSSLVNIDLLKGWVEDNTVQQRMYVMLYEDIDSLLFKMNELPIYGNDSSKFSCMAVKMYMDGALGSYGAWLMEDYADNPGNRGQNLFDPKKILNITKKALDKNIQVCVHAIGDRGNKEVLDVFEETAKSNSSFNNLRCRIEHAQHIRSEDVQRFKNLGVIASMQAIHCTSDAPFVISRLGIERARKTSYIWRTLLDHQVHLANGTDTPVESVNPFECMYAAITRKRLDSDLTFFSEEKMTREEALRSYTIWNAYAMKRETEIGSIAPGKLADFISLDRNLMTCSDLEVAKAKVQKVYINGKSVL